MAAFHPAACRRGFTLVELLVVISIIAALAAIGFPVWASVNDKVKVSSTDTLVNSVATAITTYQTKTWTWNIETDPTQPARMRTYHIFDLNHFGATTTPTATPDLEDAPKGGTKKFFSIDGYMPPEAPPFYPNGGTAFTSAPTETDPNANASPPPYDVNFNLAILNSGYRGFIAMAQPSIRKNFINKRGQVVDAWKRPLRIGFAPKVFGTQAFGVWSAGRDGKDSIISDFPTPTAANIFQDDPARPDSDDRRSWESPSAK